MGRDRRNKPGQSAYLRLRDRKRSTTVTCRLCGAVVKALTFCHLARHGITPGEYKSRYGVEYLQSEDVRYRKLIASMRRTPEEILEEIRALAKGGKRLYASEMQRTHTTLYQAAFHAYGTWLNAVEAAGLEARMHTKPHPHHRWSREACIRGIHERHARGLPLYHEAVKRDDSGLAYAGYTYFSGWDAALTEAGFDPGEIRFGSKWPEKAVIRAILKRVAEGLPIHAQAIALDACDLANAAAKRFGNWENALKAAGLNPDGIRKLRKWTDASLIREIRRYASAGQAMSHSAMTCRDGGVVSSAIKRFGNWDNALRKAGLDPEEHRRQRRPYTTEEILSIIRERHARGEALHASAIRPSTVPVAATRFFGSWDEALRRAGLDPHLIRKAHPFIAEEIIARIRQRSTEGKALHCSGVAKDDYRLMRGGEYLFGNWSRALDAAGFDGDGIARNRTTWTRVRIVETLLWRKADGLPMNPQAVYAVIPADAVTREFGTYREALRAAGLDPDDAYKARQWTRETLVAAIRKRAGSGKPLHVSVLNREDSGLYSAAKLRFGSWDAALEAAGLNPADHRRACPNWTRDRIIAAIREQAGPSGHLNSSRSKPKSLAAASLRIFGSWHAALDAAIS